MFSLVSLILLFDVNGGNSLPANSPSRQQDARSQTPSCIKTGTSIPLILSGRLTTDRNVKGDIFHLTVAEDIFANGKIAIPIGTPAIGELTLAEKKGAFGKAGNLEARLLYVTLGNRTVRISGSLVMHGQSGVAGAAVVSVAAAAIGAGPLSFMITGKTAAIEAGTPVIAVLDRDVALPD